IFYILSSLLILILLLDINMLKTFDLVNKTPLNYNIFIFLVISVSFLVLSSFILKYNWNHINGFIKKSSKIYSVFKITLLTQIFLFSLLILVNFQVVVLHYYLLHIITISLLVSYSLGFFILFYLTYKFLHWYNIKRNYLILFYSLAFGTIFLESIMKIGFTEIMIMFKPQIIFPMTIGSSVFIPALSIQYYLNNIFSILSIFSFVFAWIASSIMLKEYSNKVGGKVRYWTILSIPLIFYISQFFVQFNSQIIFQLTSNITSFSISLTIIFIFSKIIGSLLFGMPFWIITKTVYNPAIRTSMTIAGFGFVFLFLTNQAHGIVVTPFPPFGITTSLFFGLSSFLVMIGFYCSAIYISENKHIRMKIRDDIIKYDLLNHMSNRLIEDKTISYINKIRKSTKSELFVDYNKVFLNNDDIKQYVKDVINEINKKNKSNNHNDIKG
ncbi:MAG TPA: hypothetical protein VJ697_05510, partial [Nitrososphaeraceae archaeon]|nr:hypothetical protein [Nitrososphaeraceae archaeon]